MEQCKEKDFDIAGLRIGKKLAEKSSSPEQEITVGYPKKLDYIRTPEGSEFRGIFLYLDDPRNRDGYLVSPDLEEELGSDASEAEVALVGNQHGEQFVWVIKHPAYDGEPYATSKLDALGRARSQWVRLRKRLDRNGYDILEAQGSFPEPTWPEKSFDDILAEVFAGKIITSLDHPMIKRLRGEAA